MGQPLRHAVSSELRTDVAFRGKTSPSNISRPPESAANMDSDTSKDSDAVLIARYLRGETESLQVLLDRYEKQLFPFLLGILRNHHLAEDALQETWCKALQNFTTVDAGHFRAWLFTVAYHQAMLTKRKQRTRSASAELTGTIVDESTAPAHRLEMAEAVEKIRDLLEKLTPTQREVIRQRMYEGKRFREIAEDMDTPINTTLARMHEGLRKLRGLLGADYV